MKEARICFFGKCYDFSSKQQKLCKAMRFIETARLSGPDHTGLCRFKCVLYSLSFIIINNNFYLFVQDHNFSSCFSHIISLTPHQIHVGNKGKDYSGARLMERDAGVPSGKRVLELTLVQSWAGGGRCWNPTLRIENRVSSGVACRVLTPLTTVTSLTCPLASFCTSQTTQKKVKSR